MDGVTYNRILPNDNQNQSVVYLIQELLKNYEKLQQNKIQLHLRTRR